MRQISLLVFMVLTASLAYGGGKEVGLCDVFHPAAFDSQQVAIQGRISFTRHGMFLLSDECKGAKPNVVVLFPHVDGTPQVGYGLDPQVNSQLTPFVRPTGGTATACGVLDGTIFYKKNFRSQDAGAGPTGNGFVPLELSPALGRRDSRV